MSSLHRLPPEEVPSKVWEDSKNGSIEGLIAELQSEEYDGKSYEAFGQCFETIDILADESVVIASDNVRGIRTNGYITKFERIEDVPQLPALTLTPTYGGICNLFPLRDKTLICGFDSGHISKLNEGLEEQMSVALHDNQICRLSIDRLESKSVSSGYDTSLVVLDLNTFRPLKTYQTAHTAIIWDNAFNNLDDNLVLTCSRDKDVLLWDLRKQKPASKVLTIGTEPTALSWSSKDISNVFIGTSVGEVFLIDIRSPKTSQMTTNMTSKRVHRIKNVLNGKGIAICSDDNNFLVLDSNNFNCIHRDNTSHSDWVRDLTEHHQKLYTVGRDSRLICHTQLKPESDSIEMTESLPVIS